MASKCRGNEISRQTQNVMSHNSQVGQRYFYKHSHVI